MAAPLFFLANQHSERSGESPLKITRFSLLQHVIPTVRAVSSAHIAPVSLTGCRAGVHTRASSPAIFMFPG
jgi:hypothetical protein